MIQTHYPYLSHSRLKPFSSPLKLCKLTWVLTSIHCKTLLWVRALAPLTLILLAWRMKFILYDLMSLNFLLDFILIHYHHRNHYEYYLEKRTINHEIWSFSMSEIEPPIILLRYEIRKHYIIPHGWFTCINLYRSLSLLIVWLLFMVTEQNKY